MTALGKLFRTTVFKLSLAYLAIFAIGSGIVLGRAAMNVNTLVNEQIAQIIDAEINGLSEQYAQGGIRRLVEVINRRTREPGSSLYLVTAFNGDVLAGNIATLPAGVLAKPGIVETTYRRQGESEEMHSALARIFVIRSGGFRLMVGRDLEERDRLRAVLRQSLVTSLLYIVGIGMIGGLFLATRVLKRVDAMNATARTIMAGDLSGRLPIAGTRDELDRLAENLNAMLERIGELMAGMKEVSDNIAHDLKTPLTRLRARAEEALRTRSDPTDLRAALEKTIEESDSLIRIFNALLMIARAEAGSHSEAMSDLDAGEIAGGIGELYEPSAEEAGAILSVHTQPGLAFRGHRELVGQAVANLLDNALKHGAAIDADGQPARAEVEVSARRSDDHVEIVIADRGPGIATADRNRVVDRFVRLEGARSRPGSGLGLSLAAAVARLHDGKLRLEDNQPGLRVVLSFPQKEALTSGPRPEAD